MALSEDQRRLGGRFGIARKAAWLGCPIYPDSNSRSICTAQQKNNALDG